MVTHPHETLVMGQLLKDRERRRTPLPFRPWGIHPEDRYRDPDSGLYGLTICGLRHNGPE